MGDLAAVLDGVGATEPVHLVGHDWGSVQGWEAVIGDRLRGRIASFTSISGPDRRHMARWAREAVRSGPRGVAEVLGQARRSVYMPVFMAPRVGEAAARVLAAGFGRMMRLREGAEPRPGHPAETLRRTPATGSACTAPTWDAARHVRRWTNRRARPVHRPGKGPVRLAVAPAFCTRAGATSLRASRSSRALGGA